MATFRHLLTGFIAGEISPFLFGRVETEQYRYGLAICENWVPSIEGPLIKRQGFRKIRPAAASASWLTAFRRSIDQEYVVEWSAAKARFYTNGGRIESDPETPYEVTTPYSAAQARHLSLQQSFDRLYINHPSFPPAALRRDSATTFAHEVLTLVNGPFANGNINQSLTVYASAASGSVTLTASAAVFLAGHVNALFRMDARDFGNIPAWEAQMKGVVAGAKCYNEGKVYLAATSGNTGTVQPTHSEGSYFDGQQLNDNLNDTGPYGVKWTYLHDRFGLLQLTAIGSATSATATVLRRLPDGVVGSGGATWRWAHQAYSEAAGWPALVLLHDGRMIHFKDFDIIGSVVGDFGGGTVNFASFTDTGQLAADMAFRRTIATEDPPIWVARDRKLLLGTASRELAIGPTNSAGVLSGDNIKADDQSFYGGEPIAPVQAGTETIFVQRGGRRLRSADYDFARDRYDASDLTAAARHIAGSGFVQLAYQREPQAMVHAVRDDGQIVIHPKSRLEIRGFARLVLGGGARCLSAVSIIGEDRKTEELWLLVERLAGDGETLLREIWKQEPPRELGDAQDQAFYVDGGVSIAASAGQTSFTGLDHLAGQMVAVLANGGVVPNMTVSNAGVLLLPAASVPANKAFTVIVGLPYTAIAVGLRPEFQMQGQSVQGLLKRIRKMTMRLLETVGIKIGQMDPDEPDGGPVENLVDRPGNALMDAPIPLFSGDIGGNVDAAFDADGVPRWIHDSPTPAIVSAAMLTMEVSPSDA